MSWLASMQENVDSGQAARYVKMPEAPAIPLPKPIKSKLRETEDGQEKLCLKCDEWWPADLEFFHASSTGVAGLHARCKACDFERRLCLSQARLNGNGGLGNG